MLTLWCSGEGYNFSDELYTLSIDENFKDWVGRPIRLISGVDRSPIPGYHFTEGWVTICPEDMVERLGTINLDDPHQCIHFGVKKENLIPFKKPI